ncbi:MAG: hypothetical protein ACRD0V_20505, partial [Acidimicrobiales bacterium]
MLWITGRDHRSLAATRDQCPAVIRLQAVVVTTEVVKVGQLSDLVIGPGDAMVGLEADRAGTASDIAARRAPEQG